MQRNSLRDLCGKVNSKTVNWLLTEPDQCDILLMRVKSARQAEYPLSPYGGSASKRSGHISFFGEG